MGGHSPDRDVRPWQIITGKELLYSCEHQYPRRRHPRRQRARRCENFPVSSEAAQKSARTP